MSTSRGQTFGELFGELLAGYVANATATMARWAYIAWWSFAGYVLLVFLLAATGYKSAALIVFALTPLLAINVVIFVVPGMALGALLWPVLRESRIGSVVARLLQRYVKGVFGGGYFAFSLGNDVSDIMRFRWTHPLLSVLLCAFSIPAVMQELKGEEEGGFWGTFWGVGAFILSGIVNILDILRLLSNGSA